MKGLPLLAFALLAAVPAEAATGQQLLCAALENLRLQAEQSHRPQRIVFIKAEAMSSACARSGKNAVQERFCDAALRAVGIEFTHAFPWRIHDCLVARGIRPRIETSVQYTGMVRHPRRLIHLEGAWPDGTRIEIRFLATGDFGPEPEYRGYWGRYKLIVGGGRILSGRLRAGPSAARTHEEGNRGRPRR